MADTTVPRSDFYVYVLFRHDTGEPFYVGKGSGRRLDVTTSCKLNPHKRNIVLRARRAGKSIPRVRIALDLPEVTAFEIEKALILALGREPHGPLVNLTDGGEGASGHVPSEETRKKRRDALIGRVFAHQIGNAFAKGNKHKLSDATRANQSIASQARPNGWLGKAHSDQTKLKIGAKSAARSPCSEEARAKMRESGRTKVFTDTHRANLSAGKIGLSTGLIWITDGEKSKRVRSEGEIPLGWKRGHVIRRRCQDDALTGRLGPAK